MEKVLKERIISGVILVIAFLISLFLLRPVFNLFIILFAGLMLSEWYQMTKGEDFCLYSGLLIIPIPIASILLVSHLDTYGYLILLFVLSVSAVDTAAMFGGKYFKGPKLAPRTSPKKTISGLICGMLAASMIPVLLDLLPFFDLTYILANTITTYDLSIQMFFIGFIAQLSDLFISLFKRKFQVKDTGNIIPGHGGVLDRFDSYILTGPIFLVFLKSNLI